MSHHNDANLAYDNILLSGVPYPIRAERQEDYHVDLLDEGPDLHPPVPYRQHTGQQPLTDGYGPGAVTSAHKEGQPENGAEHTGVKGPWYRTGWGIIAIVIVVVVIIVGIVGGSVGGSHHSSSKSNSVKSVGSSVSSTSGGGGDSSSSTSQSNSTTTTTTVSITQDANSSPTPNPGMQGTQSPTSSSTSTATDTPVPSGLGPRQ